MTTVKWKQAVFDRLLDLLRQRGTDTFELEDVYESKSGLANLFPLNRNVRPKIRQTLQRLHDDGLLLFHGAGHYELISKVPKLFASLHIKICQEERSILLSIGPSAVYD